MMFSFCTVHEECLPLENSEVQMWFTFNLNAYRKEVPSLKVESAS